MVSDTATDHEAREYRAELDTLLDVRAGDCWMDEDELYEIFQRLSAHQRQAVKDLAQWFDESNKAHTLPAPPASTDEDEVSL
jgi:hypothetical protein